MKAKFVNENLDNTNPDIKEFLGPAYSAVMASTDWKSSPYQGGYIVRDERSTDQDSVWSEYISEECEATIALYKANPIEFQGFRIVKEKDGYSDPKKYSFDPENPWIVSFLDQDYHNELFTYKSFPTLEKAKDFFEQIIKQPAEINKKKWDPRNDDGLNDWGNF